MASPYSVAVAVAAAAQAAAPVRNGRGNANKNAQQDKDDDELLDALERILSAEENRRIMAAAPSAYIDDSAGTSAGPLTAQELQILTLLCTKASQRRRSGGGFASVEGDLLTTLTELLEKHVNLAVQVDLIQEATEIIRSREMKMDQWLKTGASGYERILGLRLGLEAASILLFIVTSPGIELRLVSEDAIKASFTLLRNHLSKNIIPALNNTGHLLAQQEAEEKKGVTSARKKRRRSSSEATGGNNAAMVRELKKLYKYIGGTVQLQLDLMERVETAVQTIFMDDQQVLTLTSSALKALEIEAAPSTQSAANRLQHATIALVTTIFRKFPMHRYSIVEDLIPLMLRLPMSKKYQRAFPVRFASSPAPDATKALTTSLYSNMLTNGPEPHYIQMITAMVLSLIQCCVVRPTFVSPSPQKNGQYNDEEQDDNHSPNGAKVFVSGLRGCQQVSDSFAIQLLQRCARKGEDGGASEFRPILNSIIEDLLLIIFTPEHVAAQMVLLSLTHGLSKDIIIASQATNSNSVEVESTYVNTAFDALGRICSAYAKILAIHRDKELHTKVTMVQPEQQVMRCYCKINDAGDAMVIKCDRCHVYYHGLCVGITRDFVPATWICDACSLADLMEEEKAVCRVAHVDETLIDTRFIMNRVMQKHLKRYQELDGSAWFHLAMWAQELDNQIRTKKGGKSAAGDQGCQQAVGYVLEQWDAKGKSNRGKSSPAVFTEEGGMRALLFLKSTQPSFKKSYENLMGLLVKLMADKHASLRKQSIRAVEKVVDADPFLMLVPKVMAAVSERLADESISVREAVVSLVGSYIVSTPALANAFHVHLMPRLLDPGVSVRKRCVKILQEILCSNPTYRGRSEACDKLLQRAIDPKEDDGVREALHSLFMKLWLEDGNAVMEAVAELASPAKRRGRSARGEDDFEEQTSTREASKNRSDFAAMSMVQTVKVAGTSENLAGFMRELLCNVNDSDKGKKAAERVKRQKIAEKQCFNLSDALFELLLSTEERRAELGNSIGAELVATIRTIGVFAEVSTSSVFKHMETILPYLKGDNGLQYGDESALASAAADILFRTTPILNQSAVEKLSAGSLGKDLVNIIYKFGSSALFSSSRALCTLAHHRDAGEDNAFGKKLMELARTCYAYLHKKSSDETFDPNVKVNILRLLSGLGCLCRHHEVLVDGATWTEEVDAEDIELTKTAEVYWDNVPIASFRLLSKFLEKDDVEVKCASLRALGGVFVAHPRLMLASAQSGLIEDVMSELAPIELQMEALRCWRDISVAEERRIDSGEAKKKLDSKSGITTSKKISGDQDGDSTLVGGVLTKQTPRLFAMTQSKEAGLRIASLELLGQLLRQGLVNPNEAVPYLLALQGDVENDGVRKFALQLLTVEGEKRPDMLRQRVCAGVKQACRFQRNVYPSNETSALVKKRKGSRQVFECVFDDVFRECIISSRKQREGLYRNLITMFEKVEIGEAAASAKKARSRRGSFTQEGPDNDTATDTPLLSFASQVLAYLPYTSAGDPLFIQHHISNIVALQGPQLQDRLANFLRPHGLASSDELDDPNAEEDALERAAKTKSPIKTQLAAPLTQEGFDWPAFIDLCKEASSLALLLRLKNFLKTRYHLTEARCMEYNPESKDKSFGRHIISRLENIAPFNWSVVTVVGHKLAHGDEDRIIRHYASFRQLMREEAKPDDVMVDGDSDGEVEYPAPMGGVDESDGEMEGVEEGMELDDDMPKKRGKAKKRRSSQGTKKRRRSK